MKSLLFKVSLSLLLISVASFSFGQKNGVVEFEKRVQKFSKVDEGEKIELVYKFRNNGKHVLSIIPPKVDCTCTEVVLPEDKIASGATDSLIIKFDTKDKIGYQERKVEVQFVTDFMDSASINVALIFKGVVRASEATKKAYKKSK
jgi:hypothetical protein